MLPQHFTTKSQEALQRAQQIAAQRQHPSLEPLHLFIALLEQEDGVVPVILKKCSVNTLQLKQEADQLLEHLPGLENTPPGQPFGAVYISTELNQVLQMAERAAQHFHDEFISTEHLLLALADGRDETARLLQRYAINTEVILQALKDVRGHVTVDSPEPETSYQALEKYSRNLTALARQDKLDPVIGRDDEIRRMMQILLRRTKNNPVLIGEAGTGKTALVEGLAGRDEHQW